MPTKSPHLKFARNRTCICKTEKAKLANCNSWNRRSVLPPKCPFFTNHLYMCWKGTCEFPCWNNLSKIGEISLAWILAHLKGPLPDLMLKNRLWKAVGNPHLSISKMKSRNQNCWLSNQIERYHAVNLFRSYRGELYGKTKMDLGQINSVLTIFRLGYFPFLPIKGERKACRAALWVGLT